MASNENSKVYALNFSKDKTSYDILFKLNLDNELDINIQSKILNTLDINEKEVSVENILNVVYNKNDNNHIIDNKVNIVSETTSVNKCIEYLNNNKHLFKDDKEVTQQISQLIKFSNNKETKKIKIKSPENKLSRKKPIIEHKLLELLKDNAIVDNETKETKDCKDEIKDLDNPFSDIESKVYYHLKLITLQTIDIKSSIVIIVTELMKFINNFDLDDTTKKNIIISSMRQFLTDKEEENIEYIVDYIIPELIDVLDSVDKRKITIVKNNKIKFFR